jgi:hypothetical protein
MSFLRNFEHGIGTIKLSPPEAGRGSIFFALLTILRYIKAWMSIHISKTHKPYFQV